MIWNRHPLHRSNGECGPVMWWWPITLMVFLSSCRPAEPAPTAIHAADCGRASEAKLPISDERLRAEIEQRTGLAPGDYTVHSRCRLDTGQFVVMIVLDTGPRAAGPSQTQTFLIQPDGRVERVNASGQPTT